MFAGANMQYVLQNGVLPDVMTPLGILLENAHTDGVFSSLNQQESGCDLDKMFKMEFALNSRISKIKNIKYILRTLFSDSSC